MTRLAALVALVLVPVALAGSTVWEVRAAMPLPRTEVAAATVGNEIMVLGGFTIDRGASTRVDAYSPATNRWRRLPDLPIGVHHAMAVGGGGRLHVLGGYTAAGVPLRAAFVLDRGRWRALPRMPFARAAAGAGVAGGRIVVAGGVTTGARRLARNALSFDLRTRRWSIVPGPTPREHLGVAALGGTVYAVAGRTAGLDTNLIHFESYRPGDRGWRRLPAVPDARGGTGATGLLGQIVSVGGEEPGGTIGEVLAYRVSERRWAELENLRTPRHGVGVAAVDGSVYVIGGGPEPGLTVSSANEALRLPRASMARLRPATTGAVPVFRRADGSRIRFRGRIRAWCGAWDENTATRTLHVAVLKTDGTGYARPFWTVLAVLRVFERGGVIRFPVGIVDSLPRGAIAFAYDRATGNEVSSEDDEARGRISFSPVSCRLGSPVRFTIVGRLGSEFLNGKAVSVSGEFRGAVGPRPAWAPR